MYQFRYQKTIITTIMMLGILAPQYHALAGRIIFATSSYEQASKMLGFDTAEKQEALLSILQIQGVFKPKTLWADVHYLDFPDKVKAFKQIWHAIELSKANKSHEEFDPKILRKALGANTEWQDMADYLLVLAQHGFGRSKTQERDILTRTTDSALEKYARQYKDSLKKIGMIDRIEPLEAHYHQLWVAGASRDAFSSRFIDTMNYIIQKKIKIDKIVMLAGDRALCAEIDGINNAKMKLMEDSYQAKTPLDISKIDMKLTGNKLAEGKNYLLSLAGKLHIDLNEDSPLIQYKPEDMRPKGMAPGNTYPNYIDPNGQKLTEASLARDIIESYKYEDFSAAIFTIIDSAAITDLHRPNTANTSYDAAMALISLIKQGEFGNQRALHILLASNQPFISRQVIAAQNSADKALKDAGLIGYKIIIHPAGYGCIESMNLNMIKSELGALLSESWKKLYNSENVKPVRAQDTLMYQTFDTISVPDMPEEIKEIVVTGENAYDDSEHISKIMD
jgi:hypothetical protein